MGLYSLKWMACRCYFIEPLKRSIPKDYCKFAQRRAANVEHRPEDRVLEVPGHLALATAVWADTPR